MRDNTYDIDNSNSHEDCPSIHNNETLIIFLKNLAISIESGDITREQTISIGEFYMKYKVQEQSDIDTSNDFDKEDFTDEEFKKFLFLGWYFYRVINNNDELESTK